jgi:hypothetical protein
MLSGRGTSRPKRAQILLERFDDAYRALTSYESRHDKSHGFQPGNQSGNACEATWAKEPPTEKRPALPRRHEKGSGVIRPCGRFGLRYATLRHVWLSYMSPRKS